MPRMFMCCLFLVSLSACLDGPPKTARPYTAAHPIGIERTDSTLDLAVPPEQRTLSAADQAQVRAFARHYLSVGYGPVTVTAASQDQAYMAGNILYASGVDGRMIAYAGTDEPGAVHLHFNRYTATPSRCGSWTKDTTQTLKNGPLPNFGCATQNNLAVMISNPRDLVVPRGMSAADPQRRATILENYRTGEDTAAERSEQETGAVSEVNQ